VINVLERRFHLSAHGTTVGTEALAGLTTFLTMGYIVFVAVMVATCLSTVIATALMAVLANCPIAGVMFVLTAGIGLRERVITAMPPSLQHAIATGIGLLIAMVGLQGAGLVVAAPGTLVTLGNLHSCPVAIIIMPLAVSITDGVAFGVVAYAALKIATGRVRQVDPLLYVFAVLFVLRYAFLRG
jgi:AGZA family xanthine/uracil permease-like MFS transporter